MKKATLALLGFAVVLTTAACHKAAPVAASRPADTTPVAPAPSTAQPTPRSSGPAAPPSQPRNEAPRQATMTPQERATLNEKLARLEDALFDYDKSAIRDDARTALAADVAVIRDILANYPSQKLLIEGHCDERGSEEYNMALGDRRAKTSEEFLSSMGIPNSQLTVISFGKDRPVCTDKSEDCWQKNRRAHVTAAP
jgi:peptidoglycan-associated lipoprotein